MPPPPPTVRSASCLLKIARQPYYRWLANPVTDTELDEAYVANAIFDAHRDDPEFGYRFLADEVRHAGRRGCAGCGYSIALDTGQRRWIAAPM